MRVSAFRLLYYFLSIHRNVFQIKLVPTERITCLYMAHSHYFFQFYLIIARRVTYQYTYVKMIRRNVF